MGSQLPNAKALCQEANRVLRAGRKGGPAIEPVPGADSALVGVFKARARRVRRASATHRRFSKEAAPAASYKAVATRACKGLDPPASTFAAVHSLVDPGDVELQLSKNAAVSRSGGWTQVGVRPAVRRVPLYLQSELLSHRLKAVVVVSALAAGLLYATLPTDAVRGLMQQRRKNLTSALSQPVLCDHHLAEACSCVARDLQCALKDRRG